MSNPELVMFSTDGEFGAVRLQVEQVTGLSFEQVDDSWFARIEPSIDVQLEEADFGPVAEDARFGLSFVEVDFEDGSDGDSAQQAVAQRIARALIDQTGWAIWLLLSDSDYPTFRDSHSREVGPI